MAVLVVEPACSAAAKVANDFVSVRGWERRQIHVRTGTHEEQFSKDTHRISFITYGILWKCLTVDQSDRSQHFGENPLQRYSAIFLDEFAELPPKSAEACRLLGKLARGNTANGDRLGMQTRIVASSYATSPQYVDARMGSHAFLTITGRHFTLDRSVVSPKGTECGFA